MDDKSSFSDELSTQFTPLIDDEDVYDRRALDIQWQEVVNDAMKDLRPPERERISSFKTPEELLTDLRRMETETSEQRSREFIVQIYPYLSVLKELTYLLMLSMRPFEMQTGLLWVSLHLTINAAMKWHDVQHRVTNVQNQLQACLRAFRHFSQGFADDKLLRRALIDVFSAMIRLWVATAKTLRNTDEQSPPEVVKSLLKTLDFDFEKTVKRIESAVDQIERLATFNIGWKRRQDEEVSDRLAPEDLPSLFDYPCVNPIAHFVGRTDELAEIRAHLCDFAPATNTTLRTAVIHGIGGVGKTSLAVQFSSICKEEKLYDVILRIDCASDVSIRSDFDVIAQELRAAGAQRSSTDENIVRIKVWLDKLRDKRRRWLIVADNLENSSILQQYLPSRGGSLLITTRSPQVAFKDFGNTKRLELGTFDNDVACQLFRSLLSDSKQLTPETTEDRHYDEKLLDFFDGHPLAIEICAAYMTWSHWTVPVMMQNLQSFMKKLAKASLGRNTSHSINTLWELQFTVVKKSVATSVVLGIICLASPAFIPESMFDLGVGPGILDKIDFVEHQEDIEDAITELENLNLVKRGTSNLGTYITVHRITQQAYLYGEFGLAGGLQTAFEAASTLMFKTFPRRPNSTSTSHEGKFDACHRVLPHAVSLIDHFSFSQRTRNPLQPTIDFFNLVQHTTFFLFETGNEHECLRLIDVGKTACENAGPEHQNTWIYSQYCNTAAFVWHERANLRRMRENMECAIAIDEQVLEPGDLCFAQHLNNLATLRYEEGRFAEARAIIDRALEIRRAHGVTGFDLARLNMMRGQTFYGERNLAEAERLFTSARDGYHAANLPRAWLSGFCSFHFGNLELARPEPNYDAAKTLFLNAMDICGSTTPMHTFVATLCYKIGRVTMVLGDYQEALDFFRKGLVIAEFRGALSEISRLLWYKAQTLEKLLHDQSISGSQNTHTSDRSHGSELSEVPELKNATNESSGWVDPKNTSESLNKMTLDYQGKKEELDNVKSRAREARIKAAQTLELAPSNPAHSLTGEGDRDEVYDSLVVLAYR